MDTTISTASEAIAKAQAQVNGTEQAIESPSQGNGEASRQSATGSDSSAPDVVKADTFIPPHVDVNTLPPALKAVVDQINKDMVRGFTEKTTKLSETIKSETAKAVEAYRQKAEQYDLMAADQEIVNYVNDLLKRRVQPDPTLDKAAFLEERLKRIEEEKRFDTQVKEMEFEVQKFVSAMDEKGKPIHDDFGTLNDIFLGDFVKTDGKKEPYSLLRAAVELADGATPQDKLANGYKIAKGVYDAIFEEGKKAGMGRLQQKAALASLPPSGSHPPSSQAPKRASNALEAIQFARQGLTPAE